MSAPPAVCSECEEPTSQPIEITILNPTGSDSELISCPDCAREVALGRQLRAIMRAATTGSDR